MSPLRALAVALAILAVTIGAVLAVAVTIGIPR